MSTLQSILVWSGAALIALAAVSGALYHDRRASEPARLGPGGNCGECHKNSVFPSHTPQFVEDIHGEAALISRERCLGCHETRDCVDCHLAAKPKWHTEGFTRPGDSAEARDAHIRIATSHIHACMECHESRFRVQCAECHQPNELPQ